MPMPRKTAAEVRGVWIGLALAVFMFGHPAFAADKEKVAKPPPTKTKPADSKQDKADHEDEGGNGFFHFLGSMLSSPTPPPAAVPATAYASEASRWAVGYAGWIVAPAATDSVALYEAPGGADHPDPLEVGTLPHGSHVVVVETHAMATGFWTRVQPIDGAGPSGWIPSWILSHEAAPKPALPSPPRPDPRWGLRLLLGGGGLGPADLDVEYGAGGYRFDLQYMRLMNYHWNSGFGFGYRDFGGKPPQAYLSGTRLDVPVESKLQSYEIGMRAGQRYGDLSGFRFDWMLGPTLAYVHERANLQIYTVVPPGTLVPVGPGGDHLGRWAGGGELRANFGWSKGVGAEIGLHMGAFMFAWEGHEQHSLATDFIHSNIHGWDVSLSLSVFN